jgi:hypothetical protein
LKLITFIWIFTGLKKLNEGVICHVLTGIAEAFSLELDIVVFILLELLVEGLILDWRSHSFGIEIFHIWKAHIPRHLGTIIIRGHPCSHVVILRPRNLVGVHISKSLIHFVAGKHGRTILVHRINVVIHFSIQVDADVLEDVDSLANIELILVAVSLSVGLHVLVHGLVVAIEGVAEVGLLHLVVS